MAGGIYIKVKGNFFLETVSLCKICGHLKVKGDDLKTNRHRVKYEMHLSFVFKCKQLPDLYAFVCLEGLTDKMRADFNIMKDLASHTRLSPEQRESRINRLISNIDRFYTSPIDVFCFLILSICIFYRFSHTLEMETCRTNLLLGV